MAPRHAGAEFGERQGPAEEDIGIFSFPVVAGGKGKATDTLGGVNGFLVTKTAPPGGRRLPEVLQPGEIRQGGRRERRLHPRLQGRRRDVKNPLVQAGGCRTRRHDLSPELLRPGSRPFGRARHQRHLGRGRGRADDAGSRGRRHPGRLRPAVAGRWRWTASRSPPLGGGSGRPATGSDACERACGLCRDPPAHVDERLGDARRLPAAGAAALHDLRRPADGRGGLVQLLQLERLWPSGKIHRPQELRLAVQQSGLPPGADQQRPHHRRLASRAIAARARRRAPDRRAHDGRGVVPDDLLPAVHPRGCRGGTHLALHARRADRPSGHRHRSSSGSSPSTCWRARTGRSPPC